MPLRWTIDHPNRFVHIVADGSVGLPEMEEHFDAIAAADGMGYAKLFDASRTDPVYSDDDVMLMGARLSAYTAALESGPLAVIGTSAETAAAFHRFVNVSPSRRPAASSPPSARRGPGSRRRSTPSTVRRSDRRRLAVRADNTRRPGVPNALTAGPARRRPPDLSASSTRRPMTRRRPGPVPRAAC